MAHSCRWRFPARPGTGRRLGARHRLSAILIDDVSEYRSNPGASGSAGASSAGTLAPGGPGNCLGVALGFDAALQVSAAIGNNLRRFRDVSGGSSGEEEQFLGFGSDEEVKGRSPAKSPKDQTTQRKPRGRPRNSLSRCSDASSNLCENTTSTLNKQETRLLDKVKKPESKTEEKKRGRPPAHGNVKFKLPQEKRDGTESIKAPCEEKSKRRKPSATFQHAAKIKKLRAGKLSPLKSKFKSNKLKLGRKGGVSIVRRRGRPPSSERFKTDTHGSFPKQVPTDRSQRGNKDVSPQPSKEDTRVSVRQSPRRMKPVRIIPSSKRTDTAIAKQLLQKAKKGAQKKMELEAAKLQGRKGGTQLKNIRQFIMPVVSTVSSRIIKTPRRFIEDEDYEPPIKIARLESAPNGSRFSTASCGSSEKSSAASQQSSQATSDDSRSSSPSVDTSTESQASEETPVVSEPQGRVAETITSVPTQQQPLESNGVRTRRLPVCNKNFSSRPAKKIVLRPSFQQKSSVSPPPPLLSPPTPLQPSASLPDHTPWLMPAIPMATPFISASRMHEKRRSILREPTFRWTSLKHSRLESQYFSSAKYAKEGLIRKPIFDNFRPPPLTPEDVGLATASGFPSHTVVGPGRLFSHIHSSGARFDVHKRSPLLRAPRFTPSEAHSRIFESVTLPPSAGRASGTSSMMGISRRSKRRVFNPIRSSEPKSPSHSMRTRSRRVGNSSLSVLASPPSSSLTDISVSPLATSALNPSFPFSSSSVTPASVDIAEKIQKPRKPTSTPAEHFTSSPSSSPALFPWFPSSVQMEKGKSKNRGSVESSKEREVEKNREKDREKENSRDSRRDKRKKSSDSGCKISRERNDEEGIVTATQIKMSVRKKPVTVESNVDISPASIHTDQIPAKNKISKKGRPVSEKTELDTCAKSPTAETQAQLPAQPVSALKHPSTSISSMLAQADKFPVSDKHVATLLRKAKAQLCKIEKSKFLKQTDQPKAQGQESDSSEASVRGPRIKHVCRRAAVALGRKRAVFPDDMPTLSALPWEEREKVLSSMGNDDKSSIAGSEDADQPAPPLKPIKQITRNKAQQEPPVKKGRRSRRCGQCPGCQVPDDCGICTNCLDKPKFGGRNIKKQCCKMRKCQNLQWMPSKAYLQKQAKAAKKKERKCKVTEKKELLPVKSPSELIVKPVSAPGTSSPPVQEEPATPSLPQKKNEPPKKQTEEKSEEQIPAASTSETKQSPNSRKTTKQPPSQPSTTIAMTPLTATPSTKKEAPKPIPPESRKKQPPVLPDNTSTEQNKQKKLAMRLGALLKSKGKEKDKPQPPSKPEVSFNLLNTLCNGGITKQKPPSDGVHRIRVDFKHDCEVENVWDMGGISLLTTAPVTPRVVCFLCASSGHVEFVYCQVCCEPFHRFCLEERERPSEDQIENWCCRHCKFCHVCGRQQQATKESIGRQNTISDMSLKLLECNKCRNSYHPECLGPNYPTKPTKKKRVWICTKCVRCKSCGSTTPGKGWDAQWSHDFSLCHDCAKLFAKGNFCPLCNKCYDDDDYESKMMQCGKCDRWVHSKCENLTDEMYEILSNLPESVAYTCINCTERHPAEWRMALTNELQASLRYVLTALLNSRTSSHLLRCRQAAKPPDLNPEPDENMPSRSSAEGPDPPILTQVGKQDEQPPLDLEGVKRKMDHGKYKSVLEMSDDIVRIIQAAMNADGGQPELKKANSMVKSFFTRQMERVFPWFSVKKSRFWEPNKVTSNSSMLPNAVLPPSLDHNYAQWQERENRLAMQPVLMKKIIPAPKPRSPGDPESPQPVQPSTPPAPTTELNREESPELPPPPGLEDNRQCALCLKYGDDNANDAGRLLYIGQDEWTHVNCALWSAEVFEDDDGSLKNVHMAVIRGKQLRCELCLKLGATVGCCLTSCTSNYHFMCSRKKNCVFLEDKKVYCQKHKDLIKGEIVSDNGFEVLRRVFVDFEGITLRRKFLNGLEPDNIHIMIGSMTIDCLGILSDLSDCEQKLFPIGYQCSRVYWSTTDARKRCVYTCKILECRPPPADPDINSTVQHEENRTIAHSPQSLHSDVQENQSTDGIKCIETLCLSSPDSVSAASVTKPWEVGRPSGCRTHIPRYSPSQRSPGSRPLPSAGSPSPVTHEIVTVGDPLLSSGLRKIGSRRHSSSSLSPQQHKKIFSPHPQTDISRFGQPLQGIPVNSLENSGNGDPVCIGASTISSKSSCSPNTGQKAIECKLEKAPEARRTGFLETPSKVSTPKTEKVKTASPRVSDPSSEHPSPKVPSQVQEMTADASKNKAGCLKDSSPALLNFKTSSNMQHQKVIRRDNDRQSVVTQGETPSLEKGKNSQILASNHGISVHKDRRVKTKRSMLDNSKDKHSSKPPSDNEHAPDNRQNEPDTNGNHMLSDTLSFRAHLLKKSIDNGISSPGNSQSEETLVSAGKLPQTKMGIDGGCNIEIAKQTTSSANQSAELADNEKHKCVSDGTGDVPVSQTNSNADSEPQTGSAYPIQESSLVHQDGSKTQEDGSYKRRYPRRSARARSNMFFGLTPLYGVRSYGEEDLPFCSSTPGKKRGKRAAEGQVDGADDISTSDDDDVYYYNFSRTVVTPGDERLGIHTLFRQDDQRDLHKIPQLDGVDDEAECNTSVTVTKSSQAGKRSGKQNGAGKLQTPEGQLEKSHVGKGQKTSEPKIENCHAVKQDTLEAQLALDTPRRAHSGSEKNLLDTFNSDLLKSDSDNNNSDDCGNILPSDIMDFVLKNTPSMQALGESPESSSSELLTLGDGLGLDNNRGKEMGLFEVFSQQLPTSEPVDGAVPTTISGEEQFELPLELPSDLSVLTTRSPALPSQNHSRLGVITDSQLSTSGERSLLAITTSSDTVEKRVTVTEKSGTPGDGDSSLLGQNLDRASEGHITPDRFITGHIDQEHISSPTCGQVDHTGREERARNSSTPNLQVSVSPSVSIQNQKYIPSSSESPGTSQIPSNTIQSTPQHLKSPAEKLVVVNQNMQPLYVLQTLPNGVTQKIQLAPSVPTSSSRTEGEVPVLSPMGGGLTLATALNPTLTSTFPSASKGILPMSHHPHLQPFPGGPQTTFLPNLNNQSSGLLIGVQPSSEPSLLVSETGQRSDVGSTSNTSAPGMNKKRQITRLHTRKNKKLAPSVSPASRHAPDVVSNMTLINFAPSQITGALTSHTGLIDLGTIGNTAPHRNIPSIIKTSKSGVMYFDQTPLLPQNVGTSSSMGTAPSVIGLDTGHLPGQVTSLATGSPVLNVVSMQPASAAPPVSGHVTLTSPGILNPSELNSISNFLIKTSPQGLGIQDNHVTLPSGPGMFSQCSTSATIATTSSICVVPSSQSVGMTLSQPINDPDCHYPISHHMNRLLNSRPQILPESSSETNARAPALQMLAESETKLTVPTSALGLQRNPVAVPQKTKSKAKRQTAPADKTSRKKQKTLHLTPNPPTVQESERHDKPAASDHTGAHEEKVNTSELMVPSMKNTAEPPLPAGQLAIISDPEPLLKELCQQDPKHDDSKQREEDTGFSSPLMRLLQQERNRQGSPTEEKPKTGLLFEISSDDGFQISAGSIEEAWKSLTEKVQEARSNARLKQLSFAGVSGLRMLGIVHDAVVFLVEQLYGANRCRNYKFRFHRPEGEEEPPINPHGSARAEVHRRKSAFDMFNFLASKHRQPPEYKPNDEEEEEVQLKSARRATSMDLPMPMRFRHLKKTSKEAVGVYRSPIHGRGLFCRRNIDAGEMVIEYSGNVIRSILTDKREKYYDGKGIGCYMFRIDDSEVVDATMHGNAARFINHSCEPNCYSRVIPIDGQKHIVIFAMRKIYRGEELTYDYKFPIEDANNKLACNCGTKKCRKFLN
ncbi:histone-lysine N-methyltransferase 2A isoform X2 [Xenopus tropicalis]|uniref:Histone-lysine N-methyltransferase n=1 Tax=Xenopus tropicalis TaxID=8364 RepID=A0A8J1K1F1_XENTR|nr:histone-lysine N-methyltransferase 2A isoform X2 [Xenopus tropicalis]